MFHVKHRKVKIMELKDTVDLMLSDDYKERFKAEYYQTKIRYTKLHNMLVRYEAGILDFEPTCDMKIFTKQLSFMGQYLYTLEVRAQMENITL